VAVNFSAAEAKFGGWAVGIYARLQRNRIPTNPWKEDLKREM